MTMARATTIIPRWDASAARIRWCPVPGDPQSLNRYSYVRNNPLKYTDPSGHYVCEENPRDRWIYSNAAVRSAHYYTHPEYEPGQVSAAETLLAATAPLWAPAVAAGGVTVGAAGEAVSWKALEWVLGRPTLARILGLGGSAAIRELADGDDDEVRATQSVYRGVRQASEYLRGQSVARPRREDILQSFEIDTINVIAQNHVGAALLKLRLKRTAAKAGSS